LSICPFELGSAKPTVVRSTPLIGAKGGCEAEVGYAGDEAAKQGNYLIGHSLNSYLVWENWLLVIGCS